MTHIFAWINWPFWLNRNIGLLGFALKFLFWSWFMMIKASIRFRKEVNNYIIGTNCWQYHWIWHLLLQIFILPQFWIFYVGCHIVLYNYFTCEFYRSMLTFDNNLFTVENGFSILRLIISGDISVTLSFFGRFPVYVYSYLKNYFINIDMIQQEC